MGVFSKLLNRFDRRIEILDDLDDHWYYLPNLTSLWLLTKLSGPQSIIKRYHHRDNLG